jgi:Protein of unknown function (DUF3078)
MKKLLLTTTLLLTLSGVFAQGNEKEMLEKTTAAAGKKVDPANFGWKKGGNLSFLFNQSAFNNEWLGGGKSNIAGNLGLNYDFNYGAETTVWDNKIIAAYGLTQIKGDDVTKSDDRIEFTSLYGKKAGQGNWYYSGFLNFKTQMDSGFLFNSGVKTKISHFFSPAYLQVGPGMLWKKSDNLKVNIAPATSRFIFVDDQFTQLGSAYGVEKGKTSRFEFGAALNGYYKINLMENISMENILNLYSNYLDKPQNIDVDYQMNLVMKINKYMSANVSLQSIYDDNSISRVQVREVFGLGVNYGF